MNKVFALLLMLGLQCECGQLWKSLKAFGSHAGKTGCRELSSFNHVVDEPDVSGQAFLYAIANAALSDGYVFPVVSIKNTNDKLPTVFPGLVEYIRDDMVHDEAMESDDDGVLDPEESYEPGDSLLSFYSFLLRICSKADVSEVGDTLFGSVLQIDL